jgi:hypothetical protein
MYSQGQSRQRKVLEILTVALPLETLLEGLVRAALGQLLAYAQPTPGWMDLSLGSVQPAEPAVTRIIVPMPASV